MDTDFIPSATSYALLNEDFLSGYEIPHDRANPTQTNTVKSAHLCRHSVN